jgi:cation diffusion facilitator CzcD-associated flavoprotein CzcO
MAIFAAAHVERDPAAVHPEIVKPGPEYSRHEHLPSFEIKDHPVENFRPMKVIVIGAGFSGIYCGIRIPQKLKNVQLTIYEKNEGVGGTWWENRYPGCACDIPCKAPLANVFAYGIILTVLAAHSYQYSFAPNPHWSKFYAPAQEIRAYLEGVVDKFSVGRCLQLESGHSQVVSKTEVPNAMKLRLS